MAIRMSLKGSLHIAALRKADVMARDTYELQNTLSYMIP